ncbi:MAG: DUF2975 domain-containing protein, partial [Candidatus Saccharimonadales bacterium]
MKRGSTIILRVAIMALGLAVLALCIFALPVGIHSDEAKAYHPIFWGMYITALPFFIALYQTLKLLTYIDANKIFSELSINALSNIKYCAMTISGLYALGMPYIFHAADSDDAPGIVVLGLVVVFASFVIATAAAVFQKLLRNAI